MNKIIKIFTLLLITTQISSCLGYKIETISYPYDEDTVEKLEISSSSWEKIDILYNEVPHFVQYEEIATILVTSNEYASQSMLLEEMKKEARKYSADAIIYIGERDVLRESFDGISMTINLISACQNTQEEDCDNEGELDTGSEYDALEIEGIAIKFIQD